MLKSMRYRWKRAINMIQVIQAFYMEYWCHNYSTHSHAWTQQFHSLNEELLWQTLPLWCKYFMPSWPYTWKAEMGLICMADKTEMKPVMPPHKEVYKDKKTYAKQSKITSFFTKCSVFLFAMHPYVIWSPWQVPARNTNMNVFMFLNH